MNPWLKGLIGAVIGGVAGAVLSVVADLTTGNIIDWKKLGTVAVIAAIASGAAYLKQSPLPPSTPAVPDEQKKTGP